MSEITFNTPGHDLTCKQGTNHGVSDNGHWEEIRLSGRSIYTCSCGAKGAGPNWDVGREIRDHLGLDENGEEVHGRGE